MKDPDQTSLGFLLSDISRVLLKRFDRRAREFGWTRAQWRVLSRLRFCQGINQSALAEQLEVEPITLARHIDRMEEKGWVERRADPNDRRAWLLYLDDTVQPTLDDLQKISDWNQETAFAGFSTEERQRLVDALERVKANLLADDTVEADTARQKRPAAGG